MPIIIGKLRKPTLEELFNETGDVRHAVMAIGENPGRPPQWALQACQTYYFQRQVEVESPGGGRPLKYSVEDGVLLSAVATLMVEQGLTVTAAVMKITGQESDGTDFRRLMRTWKQNLRLPRLVAAGLKPEKTNKWLKLARRRSEERYFKECYGQAAAEITAGNLSLELDPEEEADRLGMAEWVTLQDTTTLEDQGRIKVAPRSRESDVVAIKRLLLERMKDKSS